MVNTSHCVDAQVRESVIKYCLNSINLGDDISIEWGFQLETNSFKVSYVISNKDINFLKLVIREIKCYSEY